jgi:hypothetical protein
MANQLTTAGKSIDGVACCRPGRRLSRQQDWRYCAEHMPKRSRNTEELPR